MKLNNDLQILKKEIEKLKRINNVLAKAERIKEVKEKNNYIKDFIINNK